MKKKIGALSPGLGLLGINGAAKASLITIGTATYNGVEYKLIWEANNNGNSVIWLDYTNAQLSWSDQVAWAASLNDFLTYNIYPEYTVTWDDETWRLATMFDGIYEYGYNGATTAGYNITNSELGYLYYVELGNLGSYDTAGKWQLEIGLQNTGEFENLTMSKRYWFGTEYANSTGFAWDFEMGRGYQNRHYQNYGGNGLALRSGQVSVVPVASVVDPVPEPVTMLLFGGAAMGFAGLRRRKK